MASRYPAQIDTTITLPPVADGQALSSAVIERLRGAIISVESELGIRPSGLSGTVRARLDALENSINNNSGGISLNGDLGGTLQTPKVIGIQGRPVLPAAPILDDVLTWNGIAWTPASGGSGGGSSLPAPISGESTLKTSDIMWVGAFGLVFDGTYLWVSDGLQAGADPTNPLVNYVRVFDTGTTPPTLVQNIDLTGVCAVQNIPSLRLSQDGTKIFASIKGPRGSGASGSNANITIVNGRVRVTNVNNSAKKAGLYIRISGSANDSNNGTFLITQVDGYGGAYIDNPDAVADSDPLTWNLVVPAGRVLIFDKDTFKIVGNAEVRTGILYGSSSNYEALGARDAAELNGFLYVTNSSQQQQNVVEKFDLAQVYRNGAKPTTSILSIDINDHAEELLVYNGSIWTSSWAYTQTITRINGLDDTISSYTDPDYYISGLSYFFGSFWAGDFADNVLRFDPDTFPSAPIAVINTNPGSTLSTMGFIRNGFTSDGTYLWVPDTQGNNGRADQAKIDPETNTVVAYVAVQDPGDTTTADGGLQNLAFDGNFVWGTRRFTDNGARQSGIVKIDPVQESVSLIYTGGTNILSWVPNYASGDLSGKYPNPTVVSLRNLPISTKIPTTGQALTWDGSSWAPAVSGGGSSGIAGGDLSGTYPNPIVLQVSGDGDNVNITCAKQTSTATAKFQPFSEQVTFASNGTFENIYDNYSVPANTGVQVDVALTAINSSGSNFASWKISLGALRGGGSAAVVGAAPANTGIAPDRSTSGAAGWLATIILSGDSVIVKGQASESIQWGIYFQAFPVSS